jgi:hypothetical protein
MDALGDPVGMGFYARLRLADLQWGAGEREAAVNVIREAVALARTHDAPQHHRDELDAWLRRHGNLGE